MLLVDNVPFLGNQNKDSVIASGVLCEKKSNKT